MDGLDKEPQSCPDVGDSNAVLALNFIEGHAAGQTTGDNGYREACTFYDRLAVMNSWMNNNAILDGHSPLTLFLPVDRGPLGGYSQCQCATLRIAPIGGARHPVIFAIDAWSVAALVFLR